MAGSYTTGALVANTSTPLASHTANWRVTVSNPSSALYSAWLSLTNPAVIGTGTEIPVGQSRKLYVTDSGLICVITAGTQALGYTVE